ncbi:MAG: N-acetyltransferase family protein [Cellulophaga sp.]
MIVRKMTKNDWTAVSNIYVEGIATGFATFDTTIPSYEDWDTNHLKSCRIIVSEKQKVLGWAALSPVSSRCVYGGVAEVSIYVGRESRGLGVGKILISQLILQSEEDGYWTLQSGIFPENIGSIKLHEKNGFRLIGKKERIGKLKGIWKDNLLFEKRSIKVGVD